MADMKTVIQAIDIATGKVKSVYKKLVDLGDGTYGEATTLTGSLIDIRGKAADKPLAADVSPGATYWSVDTDPHGDAIEVSDGTSWVVI